MQWLKDQSISRKVLGLVLVMLLMLAITAGFAISKMSLVGHEIEGIAEEISKVKKKDMTIHGHPRSLPKDRHLPPPPKDRHLPNHSPR